MPVEIPLGRKTFLLDATRLSTITSTRPLFVALEDLGKSFRTTKSGPTCVNAHVWPAKTNRSITSDEYGKRGLAMSEDDPKVRAASYGEANNISIDFCNILGAGQEGFVWKTDRDTAIKVFDLQKNFERELECYQIFKNRNVSELLGFTIPELIGSDCNLRIIEMSIVVPPYVLNFGKAYIGNPRIFLPK